MLSSELFLKVCPGWSKFLNELNTKLSTDRALKRYTCSGLVIESYREKRDYISFSLGIDLSWTTIDWWSTKSSDIKNALYDRFKTSFIDTIIKIHYKCPQCGAPTNVYEQKYEDLVDKINEVEFTNSKMSYDIYIGDNHYNSCITCKKNYTREEFRLAVTAFGNLINDYNVIQPFHFDEIRNDTYENYFYSLNEKINIAKIVRFIDSQGHFKLVEYGNYLFYDEYLYVLNYNRRELTEGIEDRVSNINSYSFSKSNLFQGRNISDSASLISFIKAELNKVYYAGHFTGFKDDHAKPIYTGDIIRLRGCMTRNRDPRLYLKKDRYIPEEGEHVYEVYGVVSDSITHPETYQVPLDNHSAYLCHGIEMEVLGNIFYDLDSNNKINIWSIGCSIGQWGIPKIKSIKTIKEDLAMIKTPSFISDPQSSKQTKPEKINFLKRIWKNTSNKT